MINSFSKTFDEIVFTNNFLFYLNLVRSIKKANKSIDISLYIFELDRSGHLILKHLLEACKKGVHVNLVLDGIGSTNSYIDIQKRTIGYQNFTLSLYNPPPWPFSKIELHRHIKNNILFSLFRKINNRNHSKFFLFDNTVAYLGSHNIFDKSRFWRETSLKIIDNEVAQSLTFIMSWLLENSFLMKRSLNKYIKKKTDLSHKIYFNRSRSSHKQFRTELLHKIENSSRQIQIITPYFFPPIRIIKALIKASKNGVSIEIILPERSDVFLFPRLSRLFYEKLIINNIHIYEYSQKMIHAKQFRIDKWITIGSSNLNPRSLFKDIEVNYVIQDKDNITEINNQFERDKAQSKKITVASKNKWEIAVSIIFSKVFGAWL